MRISSYVCFMRKEDLPKICCVYFLFLKRQLIYIGQTTDFRKRMSGHEYQYLHDSVRWIECPKDKLEHYEKRLIKILKPLANYQFNRANPVRVKLSYKHPAWIRFYNLMNIYSKALESGRKYGPQNPDTTRYKLKEATREFKSRYKRNGYKGTFLDPLTPAPI
ncbi:MAG TPA: GIY-YIG nuclease family protein [Chryseolinea sp.]|nr:GIY-YIG nuclease family protein [Chryseolinea sp.]